MQCKLIKWAILSMPVILAAFPTELIFVIIQWFDAQTVSSLCSACDCAGKCPGTHPNTTQQSQDSDLHECQYLVSSNTIHTQFILNPQNPAAVLCSYKGWSYIHSFAHSHWCCLKVSELCVVSSKIFSLNAPNYAQF